MIISPASPPNPPQLLLVTSPDRLPPRLFQALEDNFQVSAAASGQQALARLSPTAVEVIIASDRLPDMSGEEFCRRLQELPAGQRTACLVLVDDAHPASIVHMFQAGADDCLPLNINPQQLVARVKALVRCCRRLRELNPLTGLPGNAYLQREITRRLPDRGQLAVIGFDLENFKAYNDVYGYYRGDKVICLVARILQDALRSCGETDDCLAHIGGDDFFVLTHPERMHNLAQAAITEFQQAIPKLYDEQDRQRGGIIGFSRQGQEVFFPLMRLIATAATNEAADIQHVGQIASVLSQLKEYAKQTGNQGLIVDRRKIHDARRRWQQRPDRGA